MGLDGLFLWTNTGDKLFRIRPFSSNKKGEVKAVACLFTPFPPLDYICHERFLSFLSKNVHKFTRSLSAL